MRDAWAAMHMIAIGAAIALALPADARAGLVEGRLVRGAEPVADGRVSAFVNAELTGEPVALSEPSGADGTYRLPLPPGRYHLAAQAQGLWAYCGQNPVAVGDEEQWIGFDLVPWQPPAYADLPGGGLEGRLRAILLQDGAPAPDVTLALYLDAGDGFRGMGYLRSGPSGPDGEVVLDLVPDGSYFVVARKRSSGISTGPVVRGDLFGYHRDNPIRVRAGEEVRIILPVVAKRRDRDVQGQGLIQSEPGFAGRLTDSQGRPVPGLHVFAYVEPEMGHHKPAAISSRSDDQGRYRITLPAPGTYYVGARGGFGDSPSPGEYFGSWNGSPDHALRVGEGEFLTGVDLSVKRVLEP